VHALTAKSLCQPVWDTETHAVIRTRFKAVSPKRVDVHALTAKSLCQPVWDTETHAVIRTRFKAVSPKR
ncbi:hypothetical protein CBL18_27520, partial [Shigella flexneri]